MWQSELTAMATDRELGESWAALAALWAQSTRTALAVLRREPPAGSAPPAEPPRTAPAAAASQPGLGEIEQLNRRIAELEQRLAEFMGREPVARRTRSQLPDLARFQTSFEETLKADRALIAGIAAYRAAPYTRQMPDPPAVWEEGESRAAGLWRRRPRCAVRAQPDQPRLYSGPDGGRLHAALARSQWRASLSAGLGLAKRGGAEFLAHRLHRRAAGARAGRDARAGGAGGVLHGRAAGFGGGVAPAGKSQRPGAARHTLGFSRGRPEHRRAHDRHAARHGEHDGLFRHAADRCAERAVRHDRPLWRGREIPGFCNAGHRLRPRDPVCRAWRTGWPMACRSPPPWRARR